MDSHQQQKLKAANQELVAKNLSLQIENEELAEKLEKHEANHKVTVATNGGSESESDVIKGLREELESCQEHLAQKKELLSEALAQLKVFLKDEEMLESEIGENEQLLEEVEDLKYDLSQSERARKWLAQRLSATVESFQKLSVRYLSQKVFGYLIVNALHEKTRRQALEKCVQRWQSGKTAGAFDKWQAACARKNKLKITCGKIVLRWQNRGISASFSKWAGDAAYTKRVQQCMRKMVLLWRNRSTGAVFERWIEHISELGRMRNVTFKIMARWQNTTMSTVFWAWAELWGDLKARADSLEQGNSRLRSLTYRMAFDSKKSDPAMMHDLTRFETSLYADVSQV